MLLTCNLPQSVITWIYFVAISREWNKTEGMMTSRVRFIANNQYNGSTQWWHYIEPARAIRTWTFSLNKNSNFAHFSLIKVNKKKKKKAFLWNAAWKAASWRWFVIMWSFFLTYISRFIKTMMCNFKSKVEFQRASFFFNMLVFSPNAIAIATALLTKLHRNKSFNIQNNEVRSFSFIL